MIPTIMFIIEKALTVVWFGVFVWFFICATLHVFEELKKN